MHPSTIAKPENSHPWAADFHMLYAPNLSCGLVQHNTAQAKRYSTQNYLVKQLRIDQILQEIENLERVRRKVNRSKFDNNCSILNWPDSLLLIVGIDPNLNVEQ